jgi:hypothetical protein
MQVMHDQEMPLGNAEPFECGGERCHVASGAGRIFALKVQCAIEGDLSGAVAAPESIAASVHDRPVQPGVEPSAVAELRKVAPCRNERFLDDVVCIGLAAEDRGRCSERSVEPSCNQNLERVNVAGCRPLDQVLVANGHHPDALRHVHTIETTADGSALGTVPNRWSNGDDLPIAGAAVAISARLRAGWAAATEAGAKFVMHVIMVSASSQ